MASACRVIFELLKPARVSTGRMIAAGDHQVAVVINKKRNYRRQMYGDPMPALQVPQVTCEPKLTASNNYRTHRSAY